MKQKQFERSLKELVDMMHKSNTEQSKKLNVQCCLCDDGSMDTVIEVEDLESLKTIEVRTSPDFPDEIDDQEITDNNWEDAEGTDLANELRIESAIESALEYVNSMPQEEVFQDA